MNLRRTIKILGAFALVIALIILPYTLYLGSNLKSFLLSQKEEELKRDLDLAVWVLADQWDSRLPDPARFRPVIEQLGRQLEQRVTLLSKEGRVLGDSFLAPDRIEQAEDLSNRPEFLSLKTQGFGQTVRYSSEMRANTLFGVVPIQKDKTLMGYLRIAIPLNPIEKAVAAQRIKILSAGGLMLLLAAIVSLLLSRTMGRPIREMTEMVQRMNQGDVKQPFHLLLQTEVKELAASLESLAVSLQDKMELLETETGELKTLLSSMREGVLVTDEKGRIILTNAFLQDVLGEKASWKKRSVQEAFMSSELQDAVEAVLKADPFQRVQLPFGRDPQRHFEVQVLALISAHRQPRAVAIFHETTELRHLLKVRQAFVANASWELDKPLLHIKGRMETLLPTIPLELPEVRQDIRAMQTEVNRLCLLVSDMLDLAKLDVQEKRNKNFERVEIRAFLTSVVEMIRDQARLKNQRVELALENLIEGEMAFWEKDRIRQALYNVLDNAVKYTPEGGQIRLSTKSVQRSAFSEMQKDDVPERRTPNSELHRDFIEISVADTGLGIPREHLPRIFERFYRVDRDYSRQLGGTGLGLSIVKHIVESHGGTVEVQTEIGQGSTFTLSLPLEPEWRFSK